MPNRWQAITWTNADLVHWRIYAALGGDEWSMMWSITPHTKNYTNCSCFVTSYLGLAQVHITLQVTSLNINRYGTKINRELLILLPEQNKNIYCWSIRLVAQTNFISHILKFPALGFLDPAVRMCLHTSCVWFCAMYNNTLWGLALWLKAETFWFPLNTFTYTVNV